MSKTSHSGLRSMVQVVGGLTSSDRARELLVRRAHGVLDRFDRVGETMQRVADLQLDVMERLRPIVDDLGELVKLSLDEARGRLNSTHRASGRIIEHPPTEDE